MTILKEFKENGTFIVGGHVRDTLLGMKSNDIDYVVVGSNMEELLSKGYKFIHAKDFPVFLDKEGNEIALARKERKIKKGYNGFECETENVTLKDDLGRRDLTINAIALIGENTYFDPYDGIKDLENKVLKHTTIAFNEDPVRVLRLARFYARYKGEFTIDKDTVNLVSSLREELKFLTKERITQEVTKVMSEEKPHLFFIALKNLNVLDILFPEIYKMIGCEHNNKHHMEGDVFNHTMMVLEEISKITKDIPTRIGALYHDIGKPYSFETNGNFHSHDEKELIDLKISELKKRYRFSKEIYSIISIGAKHHHTLHKLFKMSSKKVVKHFMSKTFAKKLEDVEKLFYIAQADSYGRLVEEDGPENTKVIFKGKDVSDYNENLKQFILNSFEKMKKVSAKEFIKENPEASIESIQQYIHRERIKTYAIELKKFKEAK